MQAFGDSEVELLIGDHIETGQDILGRRRSTAMHPDDEVARGQRAPPRSRGGPASAGQFVVAANAWTTDAWSVSSGAPCGGVS